MRRLLVTGVAFFASAGIALAVETTVTPGPFDAPPAFPPTRSQEAPVTPGPYKAPSPYAVIRLFDWTGFYLGVNGGGALTSTSWTSVPDLVNGTLKAGGGLVGGTAGYNLQTGDAFVAGVEADMDWNAGVLPC